MLEPTESFILHLQYLRSLLTSAQLDDVRLLAMLLSDWRKPGQYKNIGAAFISQSQKLHKHYGDRTFSAMNKCMVGEFALKLPQTIESLALTESIRHLYPAAFKRMESTLIMDNNERYYYPTEYFLKDIRFVAGHTVPCGAMILDLRSLLGWQPRLLFDKNAFNNFLQLRHFRHTIPWFRSHVELRYLNEFNEQGVNAFYERVADLLKAHTDVQGLISSSWFYDAKLESVSPHLNYLWKMPSAHGGFILRGSASKFDITSAIVKSQWRRQEYEAGRYKPAGCLLIWPRDQLLKWRNEQNVGLM
jgi:hypothetical protein